LPRPKTVPDEIVLEEALAIMQAGGPDSLTFAALGQRTGLSASTLVQRFRTKEALSKAALVHAWDRLDRQTEEAAKACPGSPEGAVELLVRLSRIYGGMDSYADGLLLLREDLRDPDLRARGRAWAARLSAVLDRCFPGRAGTGRILASQWQGALLWWSFEQTGPIEDFVRKELGFFVGSVLGCR
jgi:AcrR family transcriptional regulator